MSAYTSVVKNCHRTYVASIATEDGDGRSVAYLDDECGGATAFFRSHGIPRKRLVPINYSWDACTALYARTGVRPVHDRMATYLSRAGTDSHSVVWMDLQSRTVECVAIHHALRAAPYVVITLALRGASTDRVLSDATDAVRRAHGVLLEFPTPYRGKSNICNVMRLVVGRRDEPKSTKTGKTKTTKTKTTTKAATETAANAAADLVGDTLYIPVEDFPTPVDDVKVYKRHYVFRIAKTHRRRRLAVRAVKTNNRPHRVLEHWTFSPEEATRFLARP